MDKTTFQILMYALTKNAAREDFYDFLESWEIDPEEYKAIKTYLKERYGVETYV